MPIEPKDRIAIFVSIAALAGSIATPVATFFWLDPKLKEVRDNRLIFAFRDTSEHWKLKRKKSDLNYTDFFRVSYTVRLQNTGALPIKDIILSSRPRVAPKAFIGFNPPIAFDRTSDAETTYLSLRQSIGPGETVDLTVTSEFPDSAVARRFTQQEEAVKSRQTDKPSGVVGGVLRNVRWRRSFGSHQRLAAQQKSP